MGLVPVVEAAEAKNAETLGYGSERVCANQLRKCVLPPLNNAMHLSRLHIAAIASLRSLRPGDGKG